MALPSTGVLELRGGAGSDLNAGGFVPGGAGTDYSQQDAAQVTFDGVTITAVTAGVSATITLSGVTVISGHVDNYVRISGGTNFITGLYRIASVNSGANTWTLDRNCSTGVGAAMTGRMGGALNTIAQAWADAVTGNHVHVKQATYTYTAAVTAIVGIYFESYQTTRGDRGRSTVTTATNSVAFYSPASDTPHVSFRNFIFTNTAGTPGPWLSLGSFVDLWSIDLDDCFFDGFSTLAAVTNTHKFGFRMVNVEIANCTGIGVQLSTNTDSCHSFLKSVYIHDCGAQGIYAPGGNGKVIVLTNVAIANCTGDGAEIDVTSTGSSGNRQTIQIEGCVFYKNGGSGLNTPSVTGADLYSVVRAFNNVFWENGDYGWESSTALNGAPWLMRSNAFGGNTTGARNNVPAGDDEVTLTVDPFTNGDLGNFILNGTAGGGAELVDVGFPNGIPT